MKSLIKLMTLGFVALITTAPPSNANVMTLDALGDPITILYHSEDQAYTGANAFATFDDTGLVWTWDVSVTQTGTSGQIDIVGNIQTPNEDGHRRGFEFTLDGALDFVSAAIIDATDFTGFEVPFVTVTADTLSFIANNFGAPNENLHATIAFTTNTTVPVPAAVALLGLGLVGLGLRRRTAP